MVNGTYKVEIWKRDGVYIEGEKPTMQRLGDFTFDTFEDMWCFVDTYYDHYNEPDGLDFEISCY